MWRKNNILYRDLRWHWVDAHSLSLKTSSFLKCDTTNYWISALMFIYSVKAHCWMLRVDRRTEHAGLSSGRLSQLLTLTSVCEDICFWFYTPSRNNKLLSVSSSTMHGTYPFMVTNPIVEIFVYWYVYKSIYSLLVTLVEKICFIDNIGTLLLSSINIFTKSFIIFN